MTLEYGSETIAAVATAAGKGGVAVIRVSGKRSDILKVIKTITDSEPPQQPRQAVYMRFFDHDGMLLDHGIGLYFKAPSSFTGEDVFEIHCHGGEMISEMLLKEVLLCGVRRANPGEFTKRAFLNGKIDLAQAESIADLINAQTSQAVKSASASLSGAFSQKVRRLNRLVVELRVLVEASLDFPDEDIDFIQSVKIKDTMLEINKHLEEVLLQCSRGVKLNNGLVVSLSGRPNAGKSSLLNALSGDDVAIVTDVPGTTRDVLEKPVIYDGVLINIKDTAGFRDSQDTVEQEGVRRAWQAATTSDIAIWVVDVNCLDDLEYDLLNFKQTLGGDIPVVCCYNKIDTNPLLAELLKKNKTKHDVFISAKNRQGIEDLILEIKQNAGYEDYTDGAFAARERHVLALESALGRVVEILKNLSSETMPELLAQDLREVSMDLEKVTGESLSGDDLLGKIFSEFCIGK